MREEALSRDADGGLRRLFQSATGEGQLRLSFASYLRKKGMPSREVAQLHGLRRVGGGKGCLQLLLIPMREEKVLNSTADRV